MKNIISNIPFIKPWFFFLKAIIYKLKTKKLNIGYNIQLTNLKIGYSVTIGEGSKLTRTEIGDFSYLSSDCFMRDVKIGKFCSIGPRVKAGLGYHPTDLVSTHPSFFSDEKQVQHTFTNKKIYVDHLSIEIKNDVWIGANAIILDGVTIGNGAIIGAGAIVNKNVADYEIVGGVPARHIRFRCSNNEIKKLLKIKWWDWDLSQLKSKAFLFRNKKIFFENYF